MFRSWKMGSPFGIDLYVHWTFWLLPALILFNNLGGASLGIALYLVLFTLSVFGCVIPHELGHALMARKFGIGTRDITLYPIGGVARLERMSDRPWEEFWIALAGPAVNVVIALGLFLGLGLSDLALLPAMVTQSTGTGSFTRDLVAANVVLVLFNLLPAFPMDGGRVLRAVLAHFLGYLRGTQIAARIGKIMAFLFFMAAVTIPIPTLILVALFVLLAGSQELQAVRRKAAANGQEILEVVPVEEAEFSPPRADPNFSGFTWDGRGGYWVHWHKGRPVQVIGGDR